ARAPPRAPARRAPRRPRPGAGGEGPAVVAVGTRVSSRAPRTGPYGRLSRIRLPPRVCDGKDMPYAVQRLWHASLALSPVRALLVRIRLGPRPSLHQLRSGLLAFVRRLLSYFDEVRLVVPVGHRLRLLAFPMPTIVLGTNSTPMARPEISQLPVRSLCTRCGLRPRQGLSTSHSGAAHMAFQRVKTLRPCHV